MLENVHETLWRDDTHTVTVVSQTSIYADCELKQILLSEYSVSYDKTRLVLGHLYPQGLPW
jgi:hypothetical protein